MSRIPSFRDLDVWKKSMTLVQRVYELTRTYPPDERFGLVAETRKSARSIPSNIAEGKKRSSEREFCRFISIASGSQGELHTQILIAYRLGYFTDDILGGIEPGVEEIGKMLYGLERSLSLSAGA